MAEVLFLFVTDGSEYHHGIASIAGVLRANGISTALHTVDLRHPEPAQEEGLRRALRRQRPRLFAVSALSCHWERIRKLLTVARDASPARILVGGWHPTLKPEQVILHPCVDYLCLGEGEMPTLELVRALRREEDPSAIPSLWVKDENARLVRNAARPPLADLDRLPPPDRDLFDFDRLLERNCISILGPGGTPRTLPLSGGRGCPYRCSYCSNGAYQKRHGLSAASFVRRRSVEQVLREAETLAARYHPAWLEFWDEDFTLDKDWLHDFCLQYPERVHLPFSILARPTQVQDEEFAWLGQAGCGLVMMGVECGDETFRRTVLHRPVTNRQVERAFSLARANGVATLSFNMIGLPFETAAQAETTLQLNARLLPDFFIWFVYNPFPGTPLYEDARAAGLLREGHAAANYWETGAPNVRGIEPEVFRDLVGRAVALQEEADARREERFPGVFGHRAESGAFSWLKRLFRVAR